ncbi:MAG: type II toxin-antitoxin system RelE/ParE family toxin [Phycisphaeraceae bacterium]|nr:type II toxin-antitoxin system RelE/ParE family toxin [Phycisphaeraceae bacterium]
MINIIISRAAERDVESHAMFLALDSHEAAARFLERVDSTIELLRERPELGHVRRDLFPVEVAELRLLAVEGFPKHLVVYRIREENLYVVRVLHGSRDLPAMDISAAE